MYDYPTANVEQIYFSDFYYWKFTQLNLSIFFLLPAENSSASGIENIKLFFRIRNAISYTLET